MANIIHGNKSLSKPLLRPLFTYGVIESIRANLALLVLFPYLLTIGTMTRVRASDLFTTSMQQASRWRGSLANFSFKSVAIPRAVGIAPGHENLDRSTLRRRSRLGFLALYARLRNRHFFILDTLGLLLVPALAMTLLADGLSWLPVSGYAIIVYTGLALIIQLVVFYKMGLYNRYWQYAGTAELTQVVLAVGAATAVIMVLFVITPISHIAPGLLPHHALPLIAGLLAFMALGGSRFGLSGLHRWLQTDTREAVQRRILIVGAGEAGRLVVRETRTNPLLHMDAVAFVDDDPNKVGTHIDGLPVVGTLDRIPQLADELDLNEVIVAIPSAPIRRQQDIEDLCERNGIAVASLPGVFELLAGYKTISPIPKIDPNTLLGRQPVTLDHSDLAPVLRGAKVLVTGAGGSIGSELCRQLARLEPSELILLGHGENSIFEIGLNLTLSFPDLIHHSAIVDVKDAVGINRVVREHRPDIIFHAAAHKHVPYMEACAGEAITNNVQGTWNVLRAADRYNVPRLVLISTDKAVNPTSIMGTTKRIAEHLVRAVAQESDRAYMAVRFGNVIGSRGSVVPIFQWQIHAGGPLKITHPDMRRYFMTIPEAVQLVLQAATLGKGGEIFTLDMGKQVRILDLATNLIKHSGLTLGRDIKIIFSGVRPGEKMEEELFLDSERYVRMRGKLFVAVNKEVIDVPTLYDSVQQLIKQAEAGKHGSLVKRMQDLVPDYHPQGRRPKRGSTAAQPASAKQLFDPTLNSQDVRI